MLNKINTFIETTWNEKAPLLFDSTKVQSFLIVLLINVVVFMPQLTGDIINNHDWGRWPYSGNLPISVQVFVGRWFVGPMVSLSYGTYLPMITQITCFSIYTIASFIIVDFWGLEKTKKCYIIAGLLVTLNPMILSLYFYKFYMVMYAWAQLFCALSLYLVVTQKLNFYVKFFLSAILLACAFGSYQPVLAMFLVCVLVYLIVQLIKNISLRAFTKKIFLFISLFSVAYIIYKVVVSVSLSVINISQFPSHTEKLHFLLDIQRVTSIVKASFEHFLLSQPFLPFSLKLLFLILTITCLLYLLKYFINNKQIVKVIVLLSIAFLAVISTKIAAFIGQVAVFEYRFAVFGFTYIYCFSACLLLQTKLKYFCLVLSSAIIILSIYNIALCQRIEASAYSNEVALYNRVLTRLESDKNFNPDKKYIYMQIGNPPNFKKTLYKKPYDREAREILNYNFSAHWVNYQILQHLNPSLKILYSTDFTWRKSDWEKTATLRKKLQHQLESMDIWPHPNSIAVIDDVIIVVFNKQLLQKAITEF